MTEYYETIIVGGGPAGSSCAWKLNQQGKELVILDKQSFPRLKLCAGWITSRVMEKLEFTPEDYPHSILQLKTKMYVAPFPFSFGRCPTRWTDYSIRRIEFDRWLLQRSHAPVITHHVKHIEKRRERYIIDGKYECKYLVGAGGTGCPVRRTFFPHQRVQKKQIATLEKEFEYPQPDNTAYFFLFYSGLRGYSWYVPKRDGYVNIGLGGFSSYFKKSGINIHQHFQWFLKDLSERGLLDEQTAQDLKVSGYSYYLYGNQGKIKQDNCFLIGDSAGLASVDLGEGIAPAIESGLLAAGEILGDCQYKKNAISHFSLNRFWQWMIEPWLLKILEV
ncbi:MAG: NAD(P)/FAD-dependent oxidoreductase [Xenococcus sp. MO_188.B8]|nr:NAD(P)/FAD-dependent oxidoreductase [Xenococcus sp. MO_188.B8]